jgi:hypothetical protein
MPRYSSMTSICAALALLPAGIVLASPGGRGQAANQPPQEALRWSVYTDPVSRMASAVAGEKPAAPSDAPSKPIAQSTQTWNWGDIVIGRTYRGEIELSNQCATKVRVGLFAYGLPDLLIQPTATIPAGGAVGIPYRIRVTAPPASSDVIRGRLVVWFPSPSDETCASFRLVHEVSGRVRVATSEDEALEKTMRARERVAEGCVEWWLGRDRPADRTEAECLPIIRRVAVRVRQLAERDQVLTGAALTRLPAAGAIGSMSMTELAALRREFAALVNPQK